MNSWMNVLLSSPGALKSAHQIPVANMGMPPGVMELVSPPMFPTLVVTSKLPYGSVSSYTERRRPRSPSVILLLGAGATFSSFRADVSRVYAMWHIQHQN